MKGFVQLTLLALLLVNSATSEDLDSAISPNLTTNETSPVAPPDTNDNATSPTVPTNTTGNDSSPVAPPDANDNATSPTVPTNTTGNDSSPVAPPDANDNATSPTVPTNTTGNDSSPVAPPDANGNATSPTVPTNTTGNDSSPVVPPDANGNATSPTVPTNTTGNDSSPVAPPDANGNATSPTVPTNTTGNTTVPPFEPQSTSTPANSSNPGPINPTNPCLKSNCGGTSSCIALNDTSFCLCTERYYYAEPEATCKEGKIFPGTINMVVSETSGLEDKKSFAYQTLHNNITDFFRNAFMDANATDDYGQTVINKISITSPSVRSVMRADKTITASVVNIFEKNTQNTEKTVSAMIEKAVEQNNNYGIKTYTATQTDCAADCNEENSMYCLQKNDGSSESVCACRATRESRANVKLVDLCEYYGCKPNASACNDALQCECKDGFQRPSPQVPFCLAMQTASGCPADCNEKNNKYCLQKKDGSAECVCMSGYQKKSDKCEVCPFGYSGVNCEDQFQLILTIVGSIAGILILSLLIALIVACSSKSKRKDAERQTLIENDFQNLKLEQRGFSNPGADNLYSNSIFPKIRVANQPQNPYGNVRAAPRPDY